MMFRQASLLFHLDGQGAQTLGTVRGGVFLVRLLAPAAAALAVMLALLSGLIAGFLGGWWERSAAIVTDLCLSLPWLFLLLAARAILPLNADPSASILITFGLLGILGWAGPSRIILAAVKRHLGSDFVLMAQASGCPRWRVALVHVLPNLMPVAVAQFWVTAPAFLISEANLGLLGLGVAEPTPSWGGLLREMENLSQVVHAPWVLAPLALLVLVVSCCNLVVSAGEYEV